MNNIIKGLALFAAICLSSGAIPEQYHREEGRPEAVCQGVRPEAAMCQDGRMCQAKACDKQCKKDCKMQCKDCKQCPKDCKQCTKACKEQCNKDCKKQCKACKQCPKASKKQNTKK